MTTNTANNAQICYLMKGKDDLVINIREIYKRGY